MMEYHSLAPYLTKGLLVNLLVSQPFEFKKNNIK